MSDSQMMQAFETALSPTGAGPPGPWPAGLYRLNQCWDEVGRFEAFMIRAMTRILEDNPSLLNRDQPIIGVTDGSVAQPGQVGEIIKFEQTITIPVSATQTNQVLTMGVLPPGDWDCWAYTIFGGGAGMQSISFYLSPVPAGFAENMAAGFGTSGTEWVQSVVAPTIPAHLSAPGLIVFQFGTISSAANSTYFIFYARRRR